MGASELADDPGGGLGIYGAGDYVGGNADGFCGEPGGVVVLEEEVAEGVRFFMCANCSYLNRLQSTQNANFWSKPAVSSALMIKISVVNNL